MKIEIIDYDSTITVERLGELKKYLNNFFAYDFNIAITRKKILFTVN